MRIYVSVDMEGASGVTRWEDVTAAGRDHPAARRWMTADVNAAVAGARAAGATGFVVEENHGVEMLCNLLLDDLDPEVDVVRGLPRGGATTMAALDGTFDAVFLVGHHARAGSYPGFCAHTISYGDYRVVRCNGRPVGEGELFALAAGAHGVPVALVTGDDVVAAEMAAACPGVETAVVKRALSRTGGWIVPPARARVLIEEAASRAVEAVRAGRVAPVDVPDVLHMEIELRFTPEEAVVRSVAEHHPEFRFTGERTMTFDAPDPHTAFRMAAICGTLARRGTARW